MAKVNDIKIRVAVEDKATRAFNSLTKKVKLFQSTTSKLTALGGAFGLSVGFAGLIGSLKESVTKFGNQERAIARLTGSLSNVEGVTQDHVRSLIDQAAALQSVTTFGDETIISAQAMLGTFQLNQQAIEKLTPRILDMTAALEKSTGVQQDVESVTIAVGKAMTLGVGALTQYGVVISDAAIKAFELADEEEKVNIITQELDKNFKGIAEESGQTLSGRLIRLHNQFGDLQETIGGFVSVAMVGLIDSFNDANSAATGLGNNAITVGKVIGKSMVNAAQATAIAWQHVAAAVGTAKISFQGISTAGNQVNKAFAEADDPISKFVARMFGINKTTEEYNQALQQNADRVNSIISSQGDLNSKTQQFINSTESLKGEMSAVNDILDITGASIKGFSSANAVAADASEDAADAAKEQKDKIADLLKKVREFKRTQIETKDAVNQALTDNKNKLRDLKLEYDKTVASIQARIGELDQNFARSERGREESFLLSISSQVKEAKDAIKDREELIEEELMKGEAADQQKIASLKKQNEQAKAILDKNQSLIEKSEEEQARRSGARGIDFLVQQFEEEGRLAREQFEKEKAELQSQLEEKEEEFKKSNEQIRTDTLQTLTKIKKDYIETFDKLYSELKENKAVRLLQQIGLISLDPSKQAKASLDRLLAKIPKFDEGGIVPGRRGQPRLVMAHGGETILPTHRQPMTVNLGGITINNEVDSSRFLRELQRMLGGQVEATKMGLL